MSSKKRNDNISATTSVYHKGFISVFSFHWFFTEILKQYIIKIKKEMLLQEAHTSVADICNAQN